MKPMPALIAQAVAGLAALAAVWRFPQVASVALPTFVLFGVLIAWAVRVRQHRDTRATLAVLLGNACAEADPRIKDCVAQWRRDLAEAEAARLHADEQARHVAARNGTLEAMARDAQLTLLGARAGLDQLREEWPQRQLARALERARLREDRAALVRAMQHGLDDMARAAQDTRFRQEALQALESMQLQSINARLALERCQPPTADVVAAGNVLNRLCADVSSFFDTFGLVSAQWHRGMLDHVEAMRATVSRAAGAPGSDEMDETPPEIDRLAMDLRRATLQLAGAMRGGEAADEGVEAPTDQG